MDRDQRSEYLRQRAAFRMSGCAPRAVFCLVHINRPYMARSHFHFSPERRRAPLCPESESTGRDTFRASVCNLRVTPTEPLIRVVRSLKTIYPQPRPNLTGRSSMTIAPERS